MAKKKDTIPEDINAELTSPNFDKSRLLTNVGYVLAVSYTHLTLPTTPYV